MTHPLQFGNTKAFRFCHCEEGISEAPDVAIRFLRFWENGLPRPFGPRNDSTIKILFILIFNEKLKIGNYSTL